MPFQKGDYILLEYTVVDKDDNKVVETTVEDKPRRQVFIGLMRFMNRD